MGNGKSPKTKCTLLFWNLVYMQGKNPKVTYAKDQTESQIESP